MDRLLLLVSPSLNAEQVERVQRAAAALGFDALHFRSQAQALAAAAEAEVIFCDTPFPEEAVPRLAWQCTPSAGINQFAKKELYAARVMLSNSSGAYGVTISEHIIMSILEMLRRQPEYNEIVSKRDWTRDLPVRSICGSRILLLGTGDIGRTTAKRLAAFESARITGVSRSGRHPGEPFDAAFSLSELDRVLPKTDILVMSLPGTPDTFHLLDERRIALLPDGALIINVGRGSTVEQAALEKELRAGRLAAALDVFEQEPIPKDDPFWTCPNLLISPHVAGNMSLRWTVDRIVDMFTDDLTRYAQGQPLLHRVDVSRGY